MKVTYYTFGARIVCNHGPECCRTNALTPSSIVAAQAEHDRGCRGDCKEWTPPVPTLETLPLPGARAFDRIVLASAYYREAVRPDDFDEYVLLCLNPRAPFYSVVIGVQCSPHIPQNVMDAENIHDAAATYRDWGGE